MRSEIIMCTWCSSAAISNQSKVRLHKTPRKQWGIVRRIRNGRYNNCTWNGWLLQRLENIQLIWIDQADGIQLICLRTNLGNCRSSKTTNSSIVKSARNIHLLLHYTGLIFLFWILSAWFLYFLLACAREKRVVMYREKFPDIITIIFEIIAFRWSL